MGKYRMCEPYGFYDENNYNSIRNAIDDEIATNREIDEKQARESFTSVEYDKQLETVLFKNSNGDIVAQLPMTEIVASTLIKEARYDAETQQLIIVFDNDDVVTIDLNDLISSQDAGDGLKLDDNKFSILIDKSGEGFLTVSEGGLKINGVNDAIDVEKNRAMLAEQQEVNDRIAAVNEEETRATNAENTLNQLLTLEISNREQDVDDEEARAISAETALANQLSDETANRIQDVDNEESRAISAETALAEQIAAEITNRTQDVDDEETRAKAEEKRINDTIGNGFATGSTETVTYKFNDINGKLTDEITSRQTAIADEKRDRENADILLETKITAETNRATTAENTLRSDLTSEISRAASAETSLNTLIDSETTRATAKEGALSGAIDSEVSRAEAVEEEIKNAISDLVETKANKSDVYTKAETEDVVATEINKILDDAPEAYDTLKEIADYIASDSAATAAMIADIGANKSDIVALKAKDVELQGEIDSKASTSDLETLRGNVYTKAESDAKYLTEHQSLSGYATEQWVEDKHYLTEHQDISNLATKAEVEAVDDKVDAIDLTIYAKTADVNDELALKADKTEIPTDFYTQEQVNGIMSQLLTRIENLEEQNGVVVADDASAVENAAANSNLVLTSTEAIQALTSNTKYNTITIVGGNANNGDIKAIASDKLTIDGMTVNGDKGASNGRILISSENVVLKNVEIESGSTAYNIFESSQSTAASEYFTSNYEVSNLTVDNTELNHNIVNIYTFNDDAVVTIKDSYFNLDADKSNVLRLSNYTNATGVTVNFENVEWTYENAPVSDWAWAGLIIYQPSATDAALNGDTSKLATWKFNFKNCKYNGEAVNSVNYGEHSQVMYGYGINHDNNVSDISGIATVSFE